MTILNIRIEENGLTPDIYIRLRKKVDFKFYPAEDVEIALKKNLYSVVVYDGDRPIGIGRIVGDDRIVFFIKDIVVDPDYQKRNIGELIMKNILHYVSLNACPGAYVGLMATAGTEDFYRKLGFQVRPNDTMGPGMVQFYNPN